MTAIGLLMASKTVAAPETADAISPTIITNLAQFWELPAAEKDSPHRARIEMLVYYCNPAWNVFWGRSGDLDAFLPLRGIPVPLKGGDKILVDGVTIPVSQEFLWDQTSVKVLSESNSLPSISAEGRLLNAAALEKHFVEVEALVDSQAMTGFNVLRLGLLAQNFNLTAYMLVPANQTPPQLAGNFVQIKGVYSETFDSLGKVASITLWTPGLDYLNTVGSLTNDPRFSSPSIPFTTSENFGSVDPSGLVRVQGAVRDQRPGQEVTIWDASGQIRILSKQEQLLKIGDQVEAIGSPIVQGIDHILENALFRLAPNPLALLSTNQPQLRLADQIRSLDQDQLDRHPAVSVEGVVTWVDGRGRYSYILDSSGGIRCMQSRLQDGRRVRLGMIVRANGIAARGPFAPTITNAIMHQTGVTSMPDAPLVSYEEAMTGTQDGRWVTMRGYVRNASRANNFIRLELVASGGEFTARVPLDSTMETLAGSVISVKGVSVADTNSRRQLTGVEIWSPDESEVQIEQSPPPDLFALPLRPLASLRQFNLFNTLNERVRTSGTVTLDVPGRYLYLQDGDNGVLALSDQTQLLQPGDRVEVVGFCGNQGGNFLLREAAYRRISSGPELVPFQLPAAPSITEDLDGSLVRAQGTLLNVIGKRDETDFTIQSQGLIFEARLDKSAPLALQQFQLGSQVALTGVYRIQRDEYGQPRSFLLNLRSGDDVRILRPPPWWTRSRMLWVLAGALLAILLILSWAFQATRKNTLLMQSQSELKTARDRLEERVRERTRELSEQVQAKERAHERLSEAQQRLMLASRQAGMAEMATGVLHNVGNVLNSVNVSASVIGNSVQKLRIENLAKAIALLDEGGGDPLKFLTEDPADALCRAICATSPAS